MNFPKRFLTALILSVTGMTTAFADAAHQHDHLTPSAPSQETLNQADKPATDDRYTSGEILKVDTAQGKLTIRHGDIKNLGMPGMTMNFKVKDPAILDAVQVGDQVQFVVERQNGSLLITELKKAGN